MKKNRQIRTISMMTIDTSVITILKMKDNHKYSRFDAFMWLVEHIAEGQCYTHDDDSCVLNHYRVNNSELADIWHWSRPTVQKFIDELIKADIIQKQRFGNTFAFSLTASAEQNIHFD